MSEEIQVQRTDDYEEMAATWQCLEIARLNEVLKASGLSDKQLRQTIMKRWGRPTNAWRSLGSTRF